MKKALIFALSVFCAMTMIVSAMASSLSPALDVIAHSTEMTVSAKPGHTVSFDAAQFADAAGVEKYESIRITALPDGDKGTLLYNDAAVCAGQVIAWDKTDKLTFQPTGSADSAEFEFTFDGSYTMTCAIKLDANVNTEPTVSTVPMQYTYVSTVCTGAMRADDADGDALSFEVVRYPENGKLSFDKSTGEFTYTPGGVSGVESFEYRVSDGRGGISDTSEVSIKISADVPTISFADMDDSAYVAAAVTMADMGVMTYSDKDSELYFEPGEKVSRLDFLVSAMNAFGADKLPVVSKSGFDDDSKIPDKYKSYVYSAKKLGIVSGVVYGDKCNFEPDRAVTLAEASVILNNVIGYEAETVSECADDAAIWASSSVDAVYELGISDTSSASSAVNTELTKEAAANMLYRLCSLIYE